MNRNLLVSFLAILPVPAFAHVGHLGDVAGHDHWVIGTVIGVAIATGILGALKGKGQEAEPEDTPEAQEA